MPKNKPKGPVRRARKRYAAHVFRHRCAYCRCTFRSLEDATLDHIVPRRLWHTWSATALALACLDCNRRKADRFPLLIALLLCALYESAPVAVHPAVHADGRVFTAGHEAFGTPFTLATWRLLARLAHARQSTPHLHQHPGEHPAVHPDQSTRPDPIETERTAA
ncbi:HNH endonuclease [Streptomyces sp. NPDC017082]|uniref:HNH endonuclease n=1 Tax=Streptomyces sp. NPDC017082 TaxID=3364974 RepID=UPI0037A32842